MDQEGIKARFGNNGDIGEDSVGMNSSGTFVESAMRLHDMLGTAIRDSERPNMNKVDHRLSCLFSGMLFDN